MDTATQIGIDKHIQEGVYGCVGGPNYETYAEMRMLRNCGIDAIGKTQGKYFAAQNISPLHSYYM